VAAGYGPEVSERYSNSAFFFSPEGRVLGRYDKMHLVPFGEFVPLRGWLPFLQVLTPMNRDTVPGRKPVLFDVVPADGGAPVRVGALICYEDVFPYLAREFRRRGAQVLVNISDEGWYGELGELRQHVALAVFRAVETRVTVVRAANTGISCFIDPSGRIYATARRATDGRSQLVRAAAAAPVRLSARQTLYVRIGDAFAALCFAAGCLTALWPVLARAVRRRSRPQGFTKCAG
jgi:apolipoprotein N-acyltransferase